MTPTTTTAVEPVAIVEPLGAGVRLEWASVHAAHNAKPGFLYATPPRTPLTDKQIAALWFDSTATHPNDEFVTHPRIVHFARAIEAADALEQQASEMEALKAQLVHQAKNWGREREIDGETIEALRADAERYRWLRKGDNQWGICVWDDDLWVQDARTNFDALIDAALQASEGAKE